MEAVSDALQWVQNLVFLFVGAWALLRWRRRGTEQGKWLALTFLSLSVIIAVGLVTPEGQDGPVLVRKLSLVLLTVFPYLLLRFLDSFEPVPRRLRRALGVWTLAVVLWGLALPDVGDETDAAVMAFTLVIVGLWVACLGIVTVRFWRAGSGQPTLVRRRLRTLAVASTAIGLALLLIAAQQGAEVGLAAVLVQLLAVASAVSFAIGFAPPTAVKATWRQPEEQRLHAASVQLMAATTPQQVADLLVPHVRDVIGARAAALVHGDEVIAAVGLEADETAAALDGAEERTSYDLRTGALHVWTNSYTPFFGEDELELLARLAVLADLALARTALLVSEKQARAELEAANAELESFVYSASHDLKSPLIAIQSYLDVLAEESADVLDESNRFYVERMRSNARYMEALVGDLLELSRVGRVETAPDAVPLGELVGEIAAEVADQHRGVRVHVGELPTLWINPLRCRQLFRNLIENAVSHAGVEGVQVWVDARPSAEVPGGVQVMVRDDGEGIPPEYRERVFGVFERLRADAATGAGTGIGLAICRKITETAGGRIWVTDHEGGAEFAILFPPTTMGDGIAQDTTEGVPA